MTPTFQPELRNLLAHLYGNSETAHTMIMDCGLDPNDYDFDGSAKVMWRKILEEADRQRVVPAIIAAARQQYPAHEETLKELETKYQTKERQKQQGWSGSVFNETLQGRCDMTDPAAIGPKDLLSKADQLRKDHSTQDELGPRLLKDITDKFDSYRAHAKVQNEYGSIATDEQLECFDATTIIGRIRARFPTHKAVESNSPTGLARGIIMELSGPAGLGKSHIRRIIFKEFDLSEKEKESEQRERWKYTSAHPTVDDKCATFEQIMKQFLKEFSYDGPVLTGLSAALGEAISNECKAKKTVHFVFWIDNADALTEEVLNELTGESGPVGRQVRDSCYTLPPHATLRLVIATRHPRLEKFGPYPCRFEQLTLHPFELQDVKDMVLTRVPDHVRQYHPTMLDLVSEQIMSITGGHPRAIKHVLYRSNLRGWGLAPDRYAEVFRTEVIALIMRDVIGELPKNQFVFYYLMSVFRSFVSNHVRYFLAIGLLPKRGLIPVTKNSTTAVDSWLVGLSKTPALIYRSESHSPLSYIVHPVLRRVFQMDLAETRLDFLVELHRMAWNYYHQELTQKKADGLTYKIGHSVRPSLTLEALYHAAQVERYRAMAAGKSESTEEPLQELAKEYLGHFLQSLEMAHGTHEYNPPEMKELWRKDQELREVIEQLPIGDDLWKTMDNLLTRTPEHSKKQQLHA